MAKGADIVRRMSPKARERILRVVREAADYSHSTSPREDRPLASTMSTMEMVPFPCKDAEWFDMAGDPPPATPRREKDQGLLSRLRANLGELYLHAAASAETSALVSAMMEHMGFPRTPASVASEVVEGGWRNACVEPSPRARVRTSTPRRSSILPIASFAGFNIEGPDEVKYALFSRGLVAEVFRGLPSGWSGRRRGRSCPRTSPQIGIWPPTQGSRERGRHCARHRPLPTAQEVLHLADPDYGRSPGRPHEGRDAGGEEATLLGHGHCPVAAASCPSAIPAKYKFSHDARSRARARGDQQQIATWTSHT